VLRLTIRVQLPCDALILLRIEQALGFITAELGTGDDAWLISEGVSALTREWCRSFCAHDFHGVGGARELRDDSWNVSSGYLIG